ncbi:MSMEG_0572/Sll0783 family nitrogen starvation response protein [Acetobacter oryzoeni]|uniref:MSMEG_0572/Sll0783 family nitrogen starvation response protein n=1 Tax=Acetobacter oryzoeni TaxID=2500548 RepID=UPI0038D1B4D6
MTFHTVANEGSVGFVNLLQATRLIRKGFETSVLLYGPGVTLGVQRGFPRLGDEAFPGHMNCNKQIAKILEEGERFMPAACASSSLWLRRAESDPGITPINPQDVLDIILLAAATTPLSSIPGLSEGQGRTASHVPYRSRRSHPDQPRLGDDGLGTARKVCQAIRDAREKGVTLWSFPKPSCPIILISHLSSLLSASAESIWSSTSARHYPGPVTDMVAEAARDTAWSWCWA